MPVHYLIYIAPLILFSCAPGKNPSEGHLPGGRQDEDKATYYTIGGQIPVDLDSPEAGDFHLFDSVEMIRLEMPEGISAMRIDKLILHQGLYYAFDGNEELVRIFDPKGGYISAINIGLYPDHIIINPYTNKVEALHGKYIYTFALTGDSLGREQIGTLKTPEEIMPLNDSITLTFSPYNYFDARIAYYNRKKKVIISAAYAKQPPRSSKHNPNDYAEFREWLYLCKTDHFYSYRGETYFSYPRDRHIYKVTANGLARAYTLDFGKHNQEASDEEETLILYRICHTGENNRYIIADIKTKRDNRSLILDKKTGRSEMISPLPYPRIITNTHLISVDDEQPGSPVILKYRFGQQQ